MKYNKKQRAKIYLRIAESIDPNGDYDFICQRLYEKLHGPEWRSIPKYFREKEWPVEFPEFSLFEDINYKVNLEWLFEDNLERIIALLFCYHMALEAEK